jgi:RNA polymerase sigma-70 factor, ECF subfamily
MMKKGFRASREPIAPATCDSAADPESLYAQAIEQFGAALARLARGYEAIPDRRKELLQDIHAELWHSFVRFDERCSLRTWVYQVAHNTALKHVARSHQQRSKELLGLEEIQDLPDDKNPEVQADRERTWERLVVLITQLKPLDREVILLYLEDWSADEIALVSGISPVHVSTKIHRIKQLLTRLFQTGASHD